MLSRDGGSTSLPFLVHLLLAEAGQHACVREMLTQLPTQSQYPFLSIACGVLLRAWN